MKLRDFILRIGTEYSAAAGPSTPLQVVLRHPAEHLEEHVPGGIEIKAGGGKGKATLTPWFGFFDPDVANSPREGIYVVYLFAQGLRTVTLSLMQGIEALAKESGQREARRILSHDAQAIRSQLTDIAGLHTDMALDSGGWRQRAYEAGSIVSTTYQLPGLPTESYLVDDLHRFLDLYQEAVQAKAQLQLSRPGSVRSPSKIPGDGGDPLRYFKPKNEAEYRSRIRGRVLVKSRRHERLVREYGEWALERGFRASTSEHPRDLVLRRDNVEWLVEAKVLYQGRAMLAVRDALGQLYDYRHFLYANDVSLALVALFSESIGESYVEFLSACGILAVWKEGGEWHGSKDAQLQSLTD